MRKIFLLAVLAVVSFGTSAQIVKCKDAGGRVQFSDHCQSGWFKSEDVRTYAPPQAAGGTRPSWQERETDFQVRLVERRNKELAEKKEKEINEMECANARRRLEILQGGTPLITKGAFTKNPEYLEDGDRAKEIVRQNQMLVGCR
jgi:hypothetical protein